MTGASWQALQMEPCRLWHHFAGCNDPTNHGSAFEHPAYCCLQRVAWVHKRQDTAWSSFRAVVALVFVGRIGPHRKQAENLAYLTTEMANIVVKLEISIPPLQRIYNDMQGYKPHGHNTTTMTRTLNTCTTTDSKMEGSTQAAQRRQQNTAHHTEHGFAVHSLPRTSTNQRERTSAPKTGIKK